MKILLTDFDRADKWLDWFLDSDLPAKDSHLDKIGEQYALTRIENESDSDYRQRLLVAVTNANFYSAK